MNAFPEQFNQCAESVSHASHSFVVSFPNVVLGHSLTHVVPDKNSKFVFPQLVHIVLSVSLHEDHDISQNSHSLVVEL